jgi:peptidoglycan/LPS O-acetylase OafA/YrhL
MGRFHGLDACRAAAMMFGLFFHGAVSFLQLDIGWAIRDRSSSFAVDVFVWISHTFRMPVFFLLAGFFARLLYVKLGAVAFLRHRAKRLLLPFVVTLLPLVPALFFLWSWGASKQPRSGTGLRLEGVSIQPGLMWRSPSHLWFLYYLMMILSVLAGVASVGRKAALGPVDRAVRGLVRFRLVMFVMALPTAVTLFPMISLSSDTPVDFVPQLRILLYYFVFTAFGWLLQRQPDLIEEFGRRLWIPAIVALAAIVPVGILAERTVLKGPLEPFVLRLAALYLSALFGWALVMLFVGSFVKWGAHPRPWVSYLSDASYWCYLIHLPIVVALQILVADLAWPGLIKYAVVMTGTIAACLGSYQTLVRYTFIGAALNGPRHRPAPAAVTP